MEVRGQIAKGSLLPPCRFQRLSSGLTARSFTSFSILEIQLWAIPLNLLLYSWVAELVNVECCSRSCPQGRDMYGDSRPLGRTPIGSQDDWEAGQKTECSHRKKTWWSSQKRKDLARMQFLFPKKKLSYCPRDGHCTPPQRFCLMLESIWARFMKSFFWLKHLNIAFLSVLFRECPFDL